jgi:hypothetical protein
MRTEKGFKGWAAWAAAGLFVAAFVGGTAAAIQADSQLGAAQDRLTKMERLRGQIVLQDEQLTQRARL